MRRSTGVAVAVVVALMAAGCSEGQSDEERADDAVIYAEERCIETAGQDLDRSDAVQEAAIAGCGAFLEILNGYLDDEGLGLYARYSDADEREK